MKGLFFLSLALFGIVATNELSVLGDIFEGTPLGGGDVYDRLSLPREIHWVVYGVAMLLGSIASAAHTGGPPEKRAGSLKATFVVTALMVGGLMLHTHNNPSERVHSSQRSGKSYHSDTSRRNWDRPRRRERW